MRVRCSLVRGTPIVGDSLRDVLAFLGDPLIHPDTGSIEGFFVHGAFIDPPGQRFLLVQDILSWGSRIRVKSPDVLSPPEDLIRLRCFLEDPRTILGQAVRYKSSRRCLGRCTDVQFDTKRLVIEWLFLRKFLLFSRQPIAASDILEVTEEAIWIKGPLRPLRERELRRESSTGAEAFVPTPVLPAEA